jgi:RNA polymerase sigma factor for flagellar operon FliA
MEGELSPYDILVRKEQIERLLVELISLPQREQMILRQHYLNGLTLGELAALLSLTTGRVSQLHRAALVALRRRMRACGHLRVAG